MILEYIRNSIAEAWRADLERAYAEAPVVLDRSEHCPRHEVSRGVEAMRHYEATLVRGYGPDRPVAKSPLESTPRRWG